MARHHCDQNGGRAARTSRGLPPGPSGFPLLGSSLQWKGPETNLAWARQYGPIYSVRMGSKQLVYLNTIELVEEYMELKGAALLGRPEGPAAIANGLLFGQGPAWQKNRQAFLHAMWTPSLSQRYEDIVHQEIEQVLGQLSQRVDSPLQLDTVLLPALTRRLATLLLGQPLEPDGEEMRLLLQQMRRLEDVDLMSMFTQLYLKTGRFRSLLQWLGGSTIPNMFKMSEVLQGLIQGWLCRRRAALAEAGGQPQTHVLLDLLLSSPQYADTQGDTDKEMIQSVMDLFNGGVTSSLSALEFTLLFLIHHPEVQVKVKAEVDKAVAEGNSVSWGNREHFPYTRATLVEALRLASVTPSSLPHVATEDVVMEEVYEVPKDVMVLASIYSLHRDPRFYKDPELFRPERHLDTEGSRLVIPRSYRPFGVGDRLCMGYHLAEVELFLFLARLVSAFRVRAEDPSSPPPFHSAIRVVRRLLSFTCVLERWDT